jgi:hypothetical protein
MRIFLLYALACSGSDGDDGTPSATPTADTADSATAPDPCEDGDLQFVPSIGTYDLAPLFDGGPLVIQQGAQGGYHVDVGGSLGPVPDFGALVIGTLTLDGLVLASTEGAQVAYSDWAECQAGFQGARIFMDSTLSGPTLCGFVGQQATFDLRVEDLVTERAYVASYIVLLELVLSSGSCESL